MTLRMADGPVDNLPPGMNAYAGYTDLSGIGITYPAVCAKFPPSIFGWPRHLSISVHGQAPASCGDVERGALSDWRGYVVGYCAVSNANALCDTFGRPPKLWLAHYDPAIGPHICSAKCWPGLRYPADGTQWTDHGGAWDESLLLDDFFSFQDPPNPVLPNLTGDNMLASHPNIDGYWLVHADGAVEARGAADYHGGANTSNTAPEGQPPVWNGQPSLVPGDCVVGIAAAPDGHGYWLETLQGRVYAYGSATYHGGWT